MTGRGAASPDGLQEIEARSVDQIRDVVAQARTTRTPVVVKGGGTLFHVADASGAADVLRTTALDEVAYYEPADLIVTCGAGTTLTRLAGVLSERRQALPVWHPVPDRATIGGLVAFGWAGLGRQLYGRLRDRVLEVKVVTGEGKLVRGGARVVKNVTGFDLPRLIFGSLGTLGVVVEVSVKVHPAPPPLFAATVRTRSAVDAARCVRAGLLASGQSLEAVVRRDAGEWSGVLVAAGPEADARALLCRLEGAGPVQEGDDVFTATATSRLLLGDADTAIAVRAAVPPSAIPDLAELVESSREALLDAASGVAWFTLEDEETARRCRSWTESRGGSLVLLRAPEQARASIGTWGSPPPGAEIMRRLKAQLDPDGILGRGRFVV